VLAIHGAAQGLESIQILIVAIVILTVAFWRLMLRMVLIVVASLLLIGAIALFQDILHIRG
jgi:hypothetical protein